MLLDYFGVLVRFVGKMTKNNKFWAMSRVLRSGEETPRSGEGPRRSKGSLCRSEAEKEGWPYLGFTAAKLLFTVRTNVVFCFVLLFRYSKDLSIKLMRIL